MIEMICEQDRYISIALLNSDMLISACESLRKPRPFRGGVVDCVF